MYAGLIRHRTLPPEKPLGLLFPLTVHAAVFTVDDSQGADENASAIDAPSSEPQEQSEKEVLQECSTTTTPPNNRGTKKKDVAITTAPSRALCRMVAEKYLSWDLQDQDFVIPDDNVLTNQEDEAGDRRGTEHPQGHGVGDDEAVEVRENTAAVGVALSRREKKLREALSRVQINDEASGECAHPTREDSSSRLR